MNININNNKFSCFVCVRKSIKLIDCIPSPTGKQYYTVLFFGWRCIILTAVFKVCIVLVPNKKKTEIISYVHSRVYVLHRAKYQHCYHFKVSEVLCPYVSCRIHPLTERTLICKLRMSCKTPFLTCMSGLHSASDSMRSQLVDTSLSIDDFRVILTMQFCASLHLKWIV